MPIHVILLASSRDCNFNLRHSIEINNALSDFWRGSRFLHKNAFLTTFSIKNKPFDINKNCA